MAETTRDRPRRRTIRIRMPALAGVFAWAVAAGPAAAHFTTLIPEAPAAERGKPLNFLLFWGHPFERVIFDTPAPERLVALAPSGKVEALATEAAGRERRVRLTPRERGDHLVVARSAVYEVEGERIRDHVKVVVHVLTQQGWDRAAGEPMEIVPLTRPYGLRPGVAFRAQVLNGGRPLAGAPVEVEAYSPVAPHPATLPADEWITGVVKTDPNGVFTATLPHRGWWVLGAARPAADEDGKAPLVERALLWVYVSEPAAP